MLRLVAFDVYVMFPMVMPLPASSGAAPSVTAVVMPEEQAVPVTEPLAQYVKDVGEPK